MHIRRKKYFNGTPKKPTRTLLECHFVSFFMKNVNKNPQTTVERMTVERSFGFFADFPGDDISSLHHAYS